jgi:BTB/POZ domain
MRTEPNLSQYPSGFYLSSYAVNASCSWFITFLESWRGRLQDGGRDNGLCRFPVVHPLLYNIIAAPSCSSPLPPCPSKLTIPSEPVPVGCFPPECSYKRYPDLFTLRIPKLFCKQVIISPDFFLLINHLLISQVEGQTYKIHRYFLTRESQFFKDLFSLPPSGDSASIEGSDSNPITVPGTPIQEIENLLRFFYFGYETCH